MSSDCQLPCELFSEFKEALESERKIDDRIIYKLNTSIPTDSFSEQVNATDQCKALYDQVNSVHKIRRDAIQHCIDRTKENVVTLRDKASHDDHMIKELRNEQTKLRLMQNELVIEDVVRDRTLKVFRERCWQAYKPPDLK